MQEKEANKNVEESAILKILDLIKTVVYILNVNLPKWCQVLHCQELLPYSLSDKLEIKH